MLNLQRTTFNGSFQTRSLSSRYNLVMSVEQTNVKFFYSKRDRHTMSPTCSFILLNGFVLWWFNLLPIALQVDLPDSSYLYKISLVKFQQNNLNLKLISAPSHQLECDVTVEGCLPPSCQFPEQHTDNQSSS